MTDDVNTSQICIKCILNIENISKWSFHLTLNFKMAAQSQSTTHPFDRIFASSIEGNMPNG